MNSEIQKYILNFLIKMPLNRKKGKKNIYIYNPPNDAFYKKIMCCFPDCLNSKSSLLFNSDCILNSLDYYDLIIIFNIDNNINEKLNIFLDILSDTGEVWILCYPLFEIEKCIKNNIFDFSEKIPKISNYNEKALKETLDIVEMILFKPNEDKPISPKSKNQLNKQINIVEDVLENIDFTKHSKSSSFVGNKIKYYVIKNKKKN